MLIPVVLVVEGLKDLSTFSSFRRRTVVMARNTPADDPLSTIMLPTYFSPYDVPGILRKIGRHTQQTHTTPKSTTYATFPPRTLCIKENANSPSARQQDQRHSGSCSPQAKVHTWCRAAICRYVSTRPLLLRMPRMSARAKVHMCINKHTV